MRYLRLLLPSTGGVAKPQFYRLLDSEASSITHIVAVGLHASSDQSHPCDRVLFPIEGTMTIVLAGERIEVGKIHSPVLLIEYDCHHGVFLGNDVPKLFQVHTLMRAPNGGDYGRSGLADHLQRFHRKHASRDSHNATRRIGS